MTPDELRALADALEPMAKAPRFEDFDVPAFCRWLRAQADAHPAPAAPHHAMLDSHRRLVEQAIQNTEHPSGMSTHDGKARIDASILRRMLAIIDSLPAAPHPSAEDASRDAYEGCREDLLDWKRRALKAEREARNLAKALADTVNRPTFMGEPAAPQAGPKREPNPDEVICPACTHQFRAIQKERGTTSSANSRRRQHD